MDSESNFNDFDCLNLIVTVNHLNQTDSLYEQYNYWGFNKKLLFVGIIKFSPHYYKPYWCFNYVYLKNFYFYEEAVGYICL